MEILDCEEFLRKCLRKESNPLKTKIWRRGGIELPVGEREATGW
jgi:hypothetical protein